MEKTNGKRVSIRDGLFTLPLDNLKEVRIVGSKCNNCGEVMLGVTRTCSNCSSEDNCQINLSTKGKLWTYTIIRHKPPGDYKGKDPFVPFAEGLVELPEGIRIVSILECDIEDIEIGMDFELVVHKYYKDENNNDVIAYKFKSI